MGDWQVEGPHVTITNPQVIIDIPEQSAVTIRKAIFWSDTELAIDPCMLVGKVSESGIHPASDALYILMSLPMYKEAVRDAGKPDHPQNQVIVTYMYKYTHFVFTANMKPKLHLRLRITLRSLELPKGTDKVPLVEGSTSAAMY